MVGLKYKFDTSEPPRDVYEADYHYWDVGAQARAWIDLMDKTSPIPYGREGYSDQYNSHDRVVEMVGIVPTITTKSRMYCRRSRTELEEDALFGLQGYDLYKDFPHAKGFKKTWLKHMVGDAMPVMLMQLNFFLVILCVGVDFFEGADSSSGSGGGDDGDSPPHKRRRIAGL